MLFGIKFVGLLAASADKVKMGRAEFYANLRNEFTPR